jgi:ADP-ribose pyrophosphatase YjhB (NUDIX family)/O-acetyl-ADP-ribose deacetylase (regulator of RNase III)
MKIRDTEIIITHGDITETVADAIVSVTNTHLHVAEGTASLIKRKAGKAMDAEFAKINPPKMGEVFLTPGGGLKAKKVIHAVILRLDNTTGEEFIRKASRNVLLCAQQNKFSSIAFPALGCEMGEFSYEAASRIIAQEILRFFSEVKETTLKKISFVLYSDEVVEIFNKNVLGYLAHMIEKASKGPFVTVDAIIEFGEGIVLVERTNPPLGWALPGGFVDNNETIEAAVAREVKEETNLDFIEYKQFHTYSDPTRDPRFHTISTVFCGKGQGELKADSDAKDVKVYKINEFPSQIAFDHRQIIAEYLRMKNVK